MRVGPDGSGAAQKSANSPSLGGSGADGSAPHVGSATGRGGGDGARIAGALTVVALTVDAFTVDALTVDALDVVALTVDTLDVGALTIGAGTVGALLGGDVSVWPTVMAASAAVGSGRDRALRRSGSAERSRGSSSPPVIARFSSMGDAATVTSVAAIGDSEAVDEPGTASSGCVGCAADERLLGVACFGGSFFGAADLTVAAAFLGAAFLGAAFLGAAFLGAAFLGAAFDGAFFGDAAVALALAFFAGAFTFAVAAFFFFAGFFTFAMSASMHAPQPSPTRPPRAASGARATLL